MFTFKVRISFNIEFQYSFNILMVKTYNDCNNAFLMKSFQCQLAERNFIVSDLYSPIYYNHELRRQPTRILYGSSLMKIE